MISGVSSDLWTCRWLFVSWRTVMPIYISLRTTSMNIFLYSIVWSRFSGSDILQQWCFVKKFLNPFIRVRPHLLTPEARVDLCSYIIIDQIDILCLYLSACICCRQQKLWHCAFINNLLLHKFLCRHCFKYHSIPDGLTLCTLFWNQSLQISGASHMWKMYRFSVHLGIIFSTHNSNGSIQLK